MWKSAEGMPGSAMGSPAKFCGNPDTHRMTQRGNRSGLGVSGHGSKEGGVPWDMHYRKGGKDQWASLLKGFIILGRDSTGEERGGGQGSMGQKVTGQMKLDKQGQIVNALPH